MPDIPLPDTPHDMWGLLAWLIFAFVALVGIGVSGLVWWATKRQQSVDAHLGGIDAKLEKGLAIVRTRLAKLLAAVEKLAQEQAAMRNDLDGMRADIDDMRGDEPRRRFGKHRR